MKKLTWLCHLTFDLQTASSVKTIFHGHDLPVAKNCCYFLKIHINAVLLKQRRRWLLQDDDSSSRLCLATHCEALHIRQEPNQQPPRPHRAVHTDFSGLMKTGFTLSQREELGDVFMCDVTDFPTCYRTWRKVKPGSSLRCSQPCVIYMQEDPDLFSSSCIQESKFKLLYDVVCKEVCSFY